MQAKRLLGISDFIFILLANTVLPDFLFSHFQILPHPLATRGVGTGRELVRMEGSVSSTSSLFLECKQEPLIVQLCDK